MGVTFSEKRFSCGTNFFGHNYGKVVLHGSALMINNANGEGKIHKCVFHNPEHCKSKNFIQTWWNIHFKMKH